MINKVVNSLQEAVADIPDGASVMIGGFGQAGTPFSLVQTLLEQGARGLTIISNSISQVAALVENGRVIKIPLRMAADRMSNNEPMSMIDTYFRNPSMTF